MPLFCSLRSPTDKVKYLFSPLWHDYGEAIGKQQEWVVLLFHTSLPFMLGLSEICSGPFHDQRGNLWKEIDGIAMGSPLGVLSANTYMGFVEQRVFQRIPQPTTYQRYIDDTFVIATTSEALDLLKQTFVECSVLRFTCEFPQENTLPFLDVKVTLNQNQFTTSVYRKPTTIGLSQWG